MAWGKWNWRSNVFKDNGYFKVVVYWGYRQNLVTRETEILVTESSYVAMKGSNVGYPDPATIVAGIGLAWSNKVEKEFKNVRVKSPTITQEGTYKFDLPDVTFKFKHGKDGKVPLEINLWAKAQFKTFVGLATSFDWTSTRIDNLIPNLEPLPAPPKAGRMTLEYGDTWARISYDGFTGEIDHYLVTIGISTDPWINSGLRLTYERRDLLPETLYIAYVQAVDKYGQTSEQLSQEFTTLDSQAKVWVNVNGVWKKAKAWVNVNGVWKKVKKIYVNVNGVWKKSKAK